MVSRSSIVSLCVAVAILAIAAGARAADFTIPESKLLDAEFATVAWGPASVTRSDAPGSAVRFLFSDLTTESTGLKDDYMVDIVYGQTLPSHANGDFSGFDGQGLIVENTGADALYVSLFLNTGFTGPSGNPSNDFANDTFWQSAWTLVGTGEKLALRLDFDNAIPWNIDDNPEPHTQGTDGVAAAINAVDRTELSAVGFQVYSSSASTGDLLVSPLPEPGTLTLVAVGLAALLRPARRRV